MYNLFTTSNRHLTLRHIGLPCLALAMQGISHAETLSPTEGASQPSSLGEPIRTNVTEHLPTVVVEGRSDSLLGIATSANQGTVGAEQLRLRPISRAGEVLETVPGVIITQHAGGGKANQYFLRGFNLDHGTDFSVNLDGMPINLPTHGHGQGYTDMNIVIPELIGRVDYRKGVYDAQSGDFSSAGVANLETSLVLPQSLASVEGGMYGFARSVFASSPVVGRGHLLYALEAYHHDGPWQNGDDFQRFNGILGYSQGDATGGFSLLGRGYHGRWDSSDQVAESAVHSGLVPFFGSLDDTTGGDAQRYSLQAEWHRANVESATRMMGYIFYSDLDLFSNFTYFLTDTSRGDQFEQTDKRTTYGLKLSHTLFNEWWGKDVENTFGLQLRDDHVHNGLYQTEARERIDKVSSESGNLLNATTRADSVFESGSGIYYENKIPWTEKFRTVAGVRGDLYGFDVTSNRPENSGTRVAALPSPKLSLILGPWAKTEFYLQGGLGFHSNDGRGTTTKVDPITGGPTDPEGNPIRKADPMVRTMGAEAGVRTLAINNLQSTVSIWLLDIDSELVFVGDAGTTEPSRPSRRYGLEWANYYRLTKHLTLDADLSFSNAAFRDYDPSGDAIPGSIESVLAAGLTYDAGSGFFSSLRLRYFGPRPLVEDRSFMSGETILLSAKLGYRFNSSWTLAAEIFNLLDRRDHDIDYSYESRVNPMDTSTTQIHFHPVEPIQARLSLIARF